MFLMVINFISVVLAKNRAAAYSVNQLHFTLVWSAQNSLMSSTLNPICIATDVEYLRQLIPNFLKLFWCILEYDIKSLHTMSAVSTDTYEMGISNLHFCQTQAEIC